MTAAATIKFKLFFFEMKTKNQKPYAFPVHFLTDPRWLLNYAFGVDTSYFTSKIKCDTLHTHQFLPTFHLKQPAIYGCPSVTRSPRWSGHFRANHSPVFPTEIITKVPYIIIIMG